MLINFIVKYVNPKMRKYVEFRIECIEKELKGEVEPEEESEDSNEE